MHLLQRHIFVSVLFACVVAVGMFVFVLMAGNALKDLLGYLLSGQLPIESFFKMLLLLVPYVGVYALPMGILTGVLLVLGRMSAQNEITAMRAAGLSLGYIARPVLVLGVLGMVLSLFVNLYYGPRARLAYVGMRDDILRTNPARLIVPKTFIRDFAGKVFYIGEKNGSDVRDVWVWNLDKQKRTQQFIRARTGRFDFNEATNTLVITLREALVDNRDPKDPEVFSNTDYQATVGVLPVEINLGGIFDQQTRRQRLDRMTVEELLAARRALDDPSASVPPVGSTPDAPRESAAMQRMKISTTLNQKVSGALAVLAFAVLAVPLGIKVSRKETSANLGVALGLVMAYFFLTVVIGWLENYPALRPDLLLWLPSLGFLALGTLLFRRIGRA